MVVITLYLRENKSRPSSSSDCQTIADKHFSYKNEGWPQTSSCRRSVWDDREEISQDAVVGGP
jgi:hypothetical protein